jgi:hypothetical protein
MFRFDAWGFELFVEADVREQITDVNKLAGSNTSDFCQIAVVWGTHTVCHSGSSPLITRRRVFSLQF